MGARPDAAPQTGERSYALEELRGLQSQIPQLTQAMVICRAQVERHRDTDLAAARDDYSELQNTRNRLADTLGSAQLLLMEAEEYQAAAAAGQLREGLLGFHLLSNTYRPVYDALNGFAAQLPVDGTTNARVVGRLMNNIKMGYYAILNLKHPDCRRLQKRFDLELPVPNNKRRTQEKLNDLCAEYTRRQHMEQNHPNVVFIDFAQAWIERRKSEISPSTYRNYKHMVGHHMSNCFGDTPLRQISFWDIEGYYGYLEFNGLSSTTARHHHALRKSIFREAYRKGIVQEDPTESLRVPKRQPPNPIFVCSDNKGQMLKPDVLSHDFKKFLADRGLRHIRYQDLRHSCASLLLAARVPLIQVQHWLEHGSMLTTANLYAHLDPSLVDECGAGIKKI